MKEHHREDKSQVQNVGQGKLRLKKSLVGENEEDKG